MSKSPSTAQVNVRKHFSSSILLWVRTDQPRQTGMDHWKGPHSKIISATPGLEDYRQIHLAEVNPGLWPATPGVETDLPVAPVPAAGPQADQARVQGRNQRLPAHPALRRSADLVPLVRGGRARRESGRPSPDLPQAEGWGWCRRLPEAHQQGARAGPRRHRRAEGTANADLPTLEREALGHPERRARQPGRPAVPRIADLGLHGRAGAGGLLPRP